MGGEWAEVFLEDVAADITVGHVGPMASQYVEQGVPFLRSQNVDPLRINDRGLKFISIDFHHRLKKSALSPGDVVIVRTGKPGACAVIPSTLPVANCSDLVIVRCGQNLDPRFLAYYVNSVAAQHVSSHLVGAVQQHFNVGSAREMSLRLPPLSEQRAIAHILGTLDDKIELNRRMSETLEAMARALFKSWFIDFDPVRRNAARARNQPSPPAPLPEGEGRIGIHYRGGYRFSGLVETARALRKKQTPAEIIFWELVRDRRFLGLKFRRQHQLGDYVADFYCDEHRLVIELDGGVHATRRKKDDKRDAWMEAQGFKVLRFRNEELLDDPEAVLTCLSDALRPSPSGRRGGDEGVVAGAAFPPLPLGEGRGEGSVEELDRLFPARFVNSELGEIPEGWEVKCIEDVVSCVGGSTPSTKSPQYWEGGTIHWTTPKDLSGLSAPVLIDTERKITAAGLEKISSGLLPARTLLLSSRAPVGYLAIAQIPVAVNQGYIAIPPGGELSPLWMLFWAEANMERIKGRAGGTTFQEISKRNFRSMKLVAPTTVTAQAFDELVVPTFNRIVVSEQESRTLAALRDTLLPKLISGELRVKDAERYIAGISTETTGAQV